MIKRILIIAVLSIIILHSNAFALETEGEVLFRDSLYGAAIGALLGTAIYLVDQDDFVGKFGGGVIIGTIGGLIYGFTETRSFVEIEKGKIKVAIPTPIIDKKDNSTQYSASLFKTKF